MPTENPPPTRASRSAVVNRAPTKILAGLGARRTSQEVKAATEASAAAAKQAQEHARIRHEQIQQRIGQLEDKIVHEDLERKKAAARPDLNERVSVYLYIVPPSESTYLRRSHFAASCTEYHLEVSEGRQCQRRKGTKAEDSHQAGKQRAIHDFR